MGTPQARLNHSKGPLSITISFYGKLMRNTGIRNSREAPLILATKPRGLLRLGSCANHVLGPDGSLILGITLDR
jgi:hypothetical protein